jgi:hypothetical protein
LPLASVPAKVALLLYALTFVIVGAKLDQFVVGAVVVVDVVGAAEAAVVGVTATGVVVTGFVVVVGAADAVVVGVTGLAITL